MVETVADIRRRASAVDPLVADAAMAIGLTLLVCGQIWLVSHVRPPAGTIVPPGAHTFVPRTDYGVLPYLIAASTFLPLAMRRSVPWLALVFSGIAAALYQALPFPPAFTVLGPMIAVYSLAAYAGKRTTVLMALLVGGLFISVPAFAFSFGVRWVAEVVGSFMLLATAALLGDTARNRREYIAEVEARAMEAERTREEEALRRVDEERIRIAREVHDVVAHSLSIVTVQAAAAEAVFDSNPAQARESIGHIRSTSRQALGELRSMLDVLRTGEPESPLAPAADLTHLERLIAPVRESGLQVDLVTEGDLAAVPAFASVSAYRIVQESLTNAVRHAQAKAVGVRICVRSRELEIDVRDDGRGAAPNALLGGHGIQGMRERVEALGGSFAAGPAGATGFQVSATIPLPRSS